MIKRNLYSGNRPLNWVGPGLLITALAGLALVASAPAAAQTRSNAGVGKAPPPGAAAGKESPGRPGVTGLWIDHTGRGAIDIQPCGRAGKPALCGRIVWMQNPNKKNGRPLTDRLNPAKSKRRRKICGLQIISNVKRISRRVFDKGRIYDPERGKEANVELTLLSNNILQVKGYIGFKFLNETYRWRRARTELERCAGDPGPELRRRIKAPPPPLPARRPR